MSEKLLIALLWSSSDTCSERWFHLKKHKKLQCNTVVAHRNTGNLLEGERSEEKEERDVGECYAI